MRYSRTSPLILGLLLMIGTGLSRGQSPFLGQLNPLGAHEGGLHLYGVYGYSSYMSSPGAFLPGGVSQSPVTGLGLDLGHDVGIGTGTAIGWNHLGSSYTLSAVYAPSYTGFVRYSDLNSLNHSFSFNANRRRGINLDRKWHVDFSTNANVSDSTSMLFNSTFLSHVIDVPTTFDELAAGIALGSFTNDQLAALLTGSALPGSPVQLVLYGNRMLSASLGTSLTYSHSSRLSVYWNVGASRMQSLETSKPGRYVLPGSTGGSASTGLSYSLSPRTQIGVNVSTARMFSRYEDAYNTTGTVSLGRIMGRRWFFRAYGGVGFVSPLRQTYSLPQGAQYVTGASLGYKTYAHTFLVSVDRGLLDSYGLGASSTVSTSAAWSWRRPGRSWSVFSSAGQQRMTGGGFGHFNSWQANSGIQKTLTRQTGISATYAYMRNNGSVTSSPYKRSLYGVVMMFYWVPGGEWHK
jgi:hypothetical protein